MQNQKIIDEPDQCEHPNNEPIIYRSSKFDLYDGVMHRIPVETPSIIQSSTSNTWYTNNNKQITHWSSNFDLYDGMMHRIADEIPSIIQSSTSNVWYTNNGGAIAINVSSIRSKN
ncbi:hypothetical protein [Powai lake megavirus]|uniref:Uncharacterized protein n=1 Tax=Powai lake megavirus TaxID=1842663 RepID=A0A160ERT0_9VIRU|nr:hypothetical protein QJ849_gp862 [Powai lake megavirus]ANB51024.1 hypothetical protein [Powai lake megavirus]